MTSVHRATTERWTLRALSSATFTPVRPGQGGHRRFTHDLRLPFLPSGWRDQSTHFSLQPRACVLRPVTTFHPTPFFFFFNFKNSLRDVASLVAQKVKNLSAMQETQVHSLSGEDPLEKGMAAHSSILAC